MTQRTEQVTMSCCMIPAAPSSPSTVNSAVASSVGMAEKDVSTSPACFSVSPACQDISLSAANMRWGN